MARPLLEGPLYNSTGYGNMVRSIVYEYYNRNKDFHVHHIKGHPSESKDLTFEAQEFQKQLPQLNLNNITHHIKFDLPIRYRLGVSFAAPGSYKKIGMTMFEASELPPSWVAASAIADETWVPSSFCQELFESSGVKNIRKLPLGVDLSFFHRSNNYDPLKGFLDTARFAPFVKYLAIFDFVHRKAPDLIVKGFCKAFQNNENVVLIIKASSHLFSKQQMLKYIQGYIGNEKAHPQVIFIDKELTLEQLRALYNYANIYLQPSRNEGFGLTVLEAMACGTPSIVTQFGGVLDFCTEKTSLFIKTAGWRKASGFGIGPRLLDNSYFMEPDFDHFVEQLRFSYRQFDAVKTMGPTCIENSRDWGWENTTRLLDRYINA